MEFRKMGHILSELSTMTHPPWVALHSIAHSFIELEAVIQKHLNDPDNHDYVILHLEPDDGLWSQVVLKKHYYKQS